MIYQQYQYIRILARNYNIPTNSSIVNGLLDNQNICIPATLNSKIAFIFQTLAQKLYQLVFITEILQKHFSSACDSGGLVHDNSYRYLSSSALVLMRFSWRIIE